MERIKEQKDQEHCVLNKIRLEMDQINATQQKTQGPMFKEPESQHVVGLCRPDSKEDADYYYSNDDDRDYDEDEQDDSYTGPPPVMKSKPLTFEVHPGGTVALPCATVNLTDDLNVFTSCGGKRVHFYM
ncbi:uncharacterized protein LOC110841059 [Zootermopsis nevadensis]|uniref:Uncharacterized protein n=1 Tax=Zootermopsis nevadensis TaxID=136037 RepID=A0A067QE61_ZOONE|nr:uncharacterized protein LOC110841059 [Zootermopsis nevadensis]KDQ71482.1 hypothetical protein L798_13361 [Zootermopsis nevadensis]